MTDSGPMNMVEQIQKMQADMLAAQDALESAVVGKAFIAGDSFTAADVYVGSQLERGTDTVRIRAELTNGITGEAADYNRVFTTNGIACTSASIVAASQGHKTLESITDADEPGTDDPDAS